ncbi:MULTISPECIES: RBBP9/YdeN family alpha/beta hydrolase [Bradyrhizobium]|uniref:RBBP9/YdeN family alpha/beta hydrolase n=1 Tax=Bradyrhizobium TaxID=374 RepID=UPI0003F8FE86|nr:MULTISPECIES: alpha/beta fold hydrolase [Bradyrhizobium]QOG18384.1 alpha/beta fold hydrolase [Bradyrhizobium sp. SEMIA]UFW48769.1 alpha/beta fold hydrolase [Bradyrhizobium arachidis]
MHDIITLPGLGGSGDTHWQTLWERKDARFARFQPASFDQPDLDDWEQSLEQAVRHCAKPPVLVAHSLACLLVAHWAARLPSAIAGAFLVAVPDPDGVNFPAEAAAFKAVPDRALRFPALVIASTDDPYGEIDTTRQRAHAWQSGLVVLGALGHINASSGLGDWPQGRALLGAFSAGLSR